MNGRNLAKILGLLEQAKQLAEDVDPNNDRLLRFLSGINIANSVYEPLHRELAQKSRQALISAYLTKRAPAAVTDTSVEEQALEVHDLDEPISDEDDDVASVVSEIDFDGF